MVLINDVSREVNLSQKRIREYEKELFIKPYRDPKTNNRLYSDFDINQIKRVNYLIHGKGFTLASLRYLLVLAPCWNIFGCEEKECCEAYKNPYQPCYITRIEKGTHCPGPCPRWAVYLNRDFKKERILLPVRIQKGGE